ncbi:MAG TPA: DUF92 domain-containing protein [Terriglobales bacterium]|jgi:uncharacterized protein (TIGR00297 family)|nr:DUF92 domain-containing protein [Terriglobales bacterium]
MNNLQKFAVELGLAPAPKIAVFGLTTLGFATAARLLKGVTASGAVAGGAVCFLLMLGAGWGGFAALGVVFVMTWVATRVGYHRKLQLGSAEGRSGRNVGQVLANLGPSTLAAVLYLWLQDPPLLVAMSAALSEVAADTLSSEIGTVLGGTPRLLTDWEPVPAGTDGAITWLGTLAGLVSALLVSLVCALAQVISFHDLPLCAAAAMAGTLVDSLLGATWERKGLLSNNGVNFLASASAAMLGWIFTR